MYSSRAVLYHKQIICPYVINLHIFVTCSQYFVYPTWKNDLCVPCIQYLDKLRMSLSYAYY